MAVPAQKDLGEDGILVGPGGDGNEDEDDDGEAVKKEDKLIPGPKDGSQFMKLWLQDAVDYGSGSSYGEHGEEVIIQDEDEERLSRM